MREIKFRAWNNENKKIQNNVYSQSLKQPLNDFISNVQKQKIILMQFTGLKDKDGKEIYEGDIVKCFKANSKLGDDMEWTSEYSNAVIKNSGWTFYFDNINTEDYEFFYSPDGSRFHISDNIELREYEECEVIGNIYENPELLKQDANVVKPKAEAKDGE